MDFCLFEHQYYCFRPFILGHLTNDKEVFYLMMHSTHLVTVIWRWKTNGNESGENPLPSIHCEVVAFFRDIVVVILQVGLQSRHTGQHGDAGIWSQIHCTSCNIDQQVLENKTKFIYFTNLTVTVVCFKYGNFSADQFCIRQAACKSNGLPEDRIYIYICTHTHIYTHTHTHKETHIYTQTYTHYLLVNFLVAFIYKISM